MARHVPNDHGTLVPRGDGDFDADVFDRPMTLAEEAEVDREAGRPTWGTAGAADAEAWEGR